MPNHVENDLTVRGSKKDVEAFFDAVRGQGIDYKGEKFPIPVDHNKIIPYPKKFADMDKAASDYEKKHPGDWSNRPKDGYNQGGYEWCNENWGTKWGFYDFSEVNFSKTRTSATVSFSTAWSPAFPLFDKMSEMFPNLTFTVRYYERGAQFKGIYKLKGGEILEDMRGSYKGQRGG
jgi:Ferredoxin-like domain in Api92-like protein